ncbi:MAG: glycosyltransferase family 4 protein [Firmicutes bacterium]|nr:glycosyltransferase family 4 protein [Bacillota bacterium]
MKPEGLWVVLKNYADMKILMLNEIKDWGGGEVLTLDLASALVKKGVDLTLGCNKKSVLADRAKEQDIPVIEFPMRNELDIFAVIFISGLIQKQKFDIIHTHTMRDHVLGSLAAKQSRKCASVRTQHIHFPENPSFMAQLAYKRWTDVIVCNSDFIKKDLEKAGIAPDLLKVVHNGVDFGRLREDPVSIRKEFSIPEDAIVIGCAGSLFKTKGQEYLIKAFPEIISKFPGAYILIAGDGGERKNLEAMAKDTQNGGKIIFAGKRNDMANIMKSIDLMVVPSIWEEPFGLVNVESMYSGIPVIATRTGGIPEIITHNETGILIPPKNEKAIAEAVINLLENKELYNNIKTAAKEKASEYFDSKRMANDMVRVYEGVVKGK